MQRKAKDAFVKVPLWWASEAAKATRMPGMLVLIELLRQVVEGQKPDISAAQSKPGQARC